MYDSNTPEPRCHSTYYAVAGIKCSFRYFFDVFLCNIWPKVTSDLREYIVFSIACPSMFNSILVAFVLWKPLVSAFEAFIHRMPSFSRVRS